MKAPELLEFAAESSSRLHEACYDFVTDELKRTVRRFPKTKSKSFALRSYECLSSLSTDAITRKRLLDKPRKDGYSTDIKSGSLIVSWEKGK